MGSQPQDNSFIWYYSYHILVLAAPNDSIVKGRIRAIEKINSKLLINLEVTESKDVPDLANFTKPQVGKTLKVDFGNTNESNLTEGQLIDNLHVEYLGDERGGKFYG